MHSKRVVSLVITLGLLAGSLTSVNALNNEKQNINSSHRSANDNISGPVDISIANEEKIIEMLKKEGKIDKSANFEESNRAFRSYMNELAKNNKSQHITKQENEFKSKEKKNIKKHSQNQYQVKNSNEVTEVNVLTVLVEFDDYKHNEIKPGESNMYYQNYGRDHFQDMLFGENGYKGPNGENLVSMKQYYDQQSGGTLKINGKVTDWYTVPGRAASYGAQEGSNNDINARQLIKDGLTELGKDKNINLSDFDKIDRYDLDGDGNYNEPDGMIDYLMFIHAGMGQEAGGGSLGSNAIWSHRWNLGGIYQIEGTQSENSSTGKFLAYDYTINPEDGAGGVFSHEFGHDLGMPDEYDTQYSSSYSEPISNWSLMSSGSWAGKVPGTEPTGISPYSKQLMQIKYGGNWQKSTEIDYKDLTPKGVTLDLKQASETGQTVKVNLPDLETEIVKPFSGKNVYWGGKGKGGEPLKNSMTAEINLNNTNNPQLKFKTLYDIEKGWDFASIQVREKGSQDWNYIQGNITTKDHDPGAEVVIPNGITGKSDGWIDAIFDLSNYKGKDVEIKFEYQTDKYTFGSGFYVDDISIFDDNNELFFDNAEEGSKFELNGFNIDKGKVYSKNYYLIEWRNHDGVDKGLAGINSFGQMYEYDPGMVVWYVNDYYSENWTGVHPGGGYLSVVDADQTNIPWHFYDKETESLIASNKYQMHDAAFSSKKGSKFSIDAGESYGRIAIDKYSSSNPKFSDKKDFTNQAAPELGVKVPQLGMEIKILHQAKDNSSATINISKK